MKKKKTLETNSAQRSIYGVGFGKCDMKAKGKRKQ